MRAPTAPILMYAPLLLPASHAAVAVRCTFFARALRAEGLDVTIWTHSTVAGATRLVLPAASNLWPTAVRALYEVVVAGECALRLAWRRLSSPKTVVVLSSPPFVTCLLIALLCRLMGLSYTWDARDVYPEALFSMGVVRSDSRFGRFLSILMRGVYRRSALVSTTSKTFAATIRGQLGASTEVSLVRNGFDEEHFRPAAIRRTAADAFICVNHGLLGRIHNIRLLLEVADSVAALRPEILFLVIGDGPKQGLIEARERANVRYLGPRPYHEIPGLLAGADAGLAFIEDGPGSDGAFPVKVYEYIGTGLPCLITPQSEAGRLVAATGCGVAFANGDREGIAKRIVELADRGPAFDAMREASRRVGAEFGRRRAAAGFARRLAERASA